MKKLALLVLVALMGFAQHLNAQDIVNKTSCSVSVQIVFYNAITCNITGTCTTLIVPAHSTVAIPPCISSTATLLGFEICWSPAACTNCVSIGNATGAHPCVQFPAGPVGLTTECSDCIISGAVVPIAWSLGGNLIIG